MTTAEVDACTLRKSVSQAVMSGTPVFRCKFGQPGLIERVKVVGVFEVGTDCSCRLKDVSRQVL